MTSYLLDTNILIYYLAGAIPDDERSFIERVILESFNISIITRIELLGWRGHTPEGLEKAKKLFDCARCLPLTVAIAESSIDIRTTINISLPDAVIAASALSLNAILITRTEKDFDGVSGLVVYNPFSK